jgi:hypothetical protein
VTGGAPGPTLHRLKSYAPARLTGAQAAKRHHLPRTTLTKPAASIHNAHDSLTATTTICLLPRGYA